MAICRHHAQPALSPVCGVHVRAQLPHSQELRNRNRPRTPRIAHKHQAQVEFLVFRYTHGHKTMYKTLVRCPEAWTSSEAPGGV